MKSLSKTWWWLVILMLVLSTSISAQKWIKKSFCENVKFLSAAQYDVNTAYVVGEKGNAMLTHDHGDSWFRIPVETKFDLNSIKFLNEVTSLIVGDRGTIFRTNNLWNDWEDISVRYNYYHKDLSFYNPKQIIIAGYKHLFSSNSPQPYVSILLSEDGGNTWTDRAPVLTGQLNSIICFGSNNAIAVGNRGLLLYTVDGGNQWNSQVISKSDLNQVRICPNGMLVIVGDEGTILVSKGLNAITSTSLVQFKFRNYSINPLIDVKSICFKGDDTFVIAGHQRFEEIDLEQAVIMHSQNLNGKWITEFKEPFATLNVVNFCNVKSAIAVGDNGMIAVYEDIKVTGNKTTSELSLGINVQNFPNPFNPVTTINYNLPAKSSVILEVFNSIGEKVCELVNDVREEGNYNVIFNAAELPSGVYISRLNTVDVKSGNSFVETKKMLLLK